MADLSDLQARYREFVEARDWTQFHTPKNAAEAVSVEAGELLELFLWHDSVSAAQVKSDEELLERIKEETADVVIYCLSLAVHLDFDLSEAIAEKLDENESRFDPNTAEEITESLQRWQK